MDSLSTRVRMGKGVLSNEKWVTVEKMLLGRRLFWVLNEAVESRAKCLFSALDSRTK